MVFTLMYLEYEASLLYILIDYWQNRYKVSPYFETNQVDGTFSSGLIYITEVSDFGWAG